MSLQVWLPLNGDLHNQGLKQYNLNLFRGSEIYNNNGKIGKCFYANGVNTIKILNIIPDFYNYTEYSLCAWFYIEGQNTSHSGSAIISAGNWNAQVLNLSVSDWSSDHYTRLRISGTNWNNTYAYNFQKNVWYHVVVSSDGNKTYAYVNGNLLGNTVVGFLPTNIEGNDICIGGATYYAGMQFFGRINDVRIYNHALSATEVEEISKGLILHYQLNGFVNGVNDNLLLNSRTFGTGWYGSGTTTQNAFQDYYAVKYKNNSSGTSVSDSVVYNNVTTVQPGETYTGSFYAKADTSSSLTCYFYNNSSGIVQVVAKTASNGTTNVSSDGATTFSIDSTWKRYWVTWTFGTTGNAALKTFIVCRLMANASGISIAKVKLEKGNVPTAYTPAFSEITNLNDSIIYDSSGYNHNGTITGQLEIVQPSPKFNCATYINSPDPTTNSTTGEYYILADCGLTTPSTMSVAWWANPESGYGNTINHAMWCTTTLDTGADYQASAFNHRDAGFDVNSSDNTHLRLSTASFVANEWHHYVVTYDGQTAKLYKDGTQQSSVAFSAAKTLGSFTKVIIGHSRAGSVHRKMKGKYSDFRIYATALTAAQVKDLYRTSMIVDGTTVRPRDLE